MQPVFAAFLVTGPAQRLAISWPLLNAKARAGDVDELADAWAALSGCSRHEALRLGPSLRASGICKADGSLDADAEAFIVSRLVGKKAAT